MRLQIKTLKPLTLTLLAVCVSVGSINAQRSAIVPEQGEKLDSTIGKGIGIDQRLGHTLPLDLAFTDTNGEAVVLGDFFNDKPVVLSLVYYECPMLCTQVLNGMLRSFKVLRFSVGEEFDVVTVSIDPDERPELAAAKKQEYVERYRRDSGENGWNFLTGSKEQINQLAEAMGFRYEYDEETGLYTHASAIMVATPDGKLSRYFYGVDYAPKDLRLGLIEASNNQIGNPVDQLLLLCFKYDPSTGKYTLMVLNAMRIGGIATVLVLAVFVGTMLRRERRKKPHLVDDVGVSTITTNNP